MVDTLTARQQFSNVLLELGIHASQIEDGFDLEETASYNTLPGVYKLAKTIPSLASAFRLFKAKYVAPNTHLYLSETHFCNSAHTADIVQKLHTTEASTAVQYIRDLYARARNLLSTHDIAATPNNIAIVMALATYRCPGTNHGNIAALPHCSGDQAWENVYLPFIQAGANLTDIVAACAQRIGQPLELNYLMHTIPVRYGVFNLHDNHDTLATIRLGIYGD